MEVVLAKSAGFCFGVDRALKKVYDNLDVEHIYTYGPIIHNNFVVDSLAQQGVQVVDDLTRLSQLPKGHMVIRSHGITRKDHEIIERSGFTSIEATCPYVKRIHKIVEKASLEGRVPVIIGNPNHPEVEGIAGWSLKPVLIFETMAALNAYFFDADLTYEVVAQTTFNIHLFEQMVQTLHNLNIRVIINETICNATSLRQTEAEEIASRVDLMLVIGSKHSSNTRKLYEICKRQCVNTYHIESIEEFELDLLSGISSVGITAGASTPKKLIEEVISNVRNAK